MIRRGSQVRRALNPSPALSQLLVAAVCVGSFEWQRATKDRCVGEAASTLAAAAQRCHGRHRA